MTHDKRQEGWHVPHRLRQLRPAVAASLETANTQSWAVVDPDLLELARLRVAGMIGSTQGRARRSAAARAAGLAEDKIAALAQWPSDPRFTHREQDCLAFVEQYVMDVAGMSDEQVAVAERHFDGGGFRDFVTALYITEVTLRLELAGDALLQPADSPMEASA